MTYDWYGHREESWRVELLDLSDNVLSDLDGVADPAGTLEYSVHAPIRGSGNLSLTATGDVDWAAHRVRVSYLFGDLVVPLITAIPKAPKEDHDGHGVTIELELYDKTLILADDSFGGTLALDVGTPVLDAVRDIIESTGNPRQLVGESAETLRSPMVWDPEDHKLRQVNDLLAASGHFALSCDGMGRFRADPYVGPEYRGVAWTFTHDAQGLYLPEFRRDRDAFSVPNRYRCVSRADEDTPALVSVAEDYDGPFGFNRHGRWVTRTETDVEATSQAVLDQYTGRRLSEVQQVTEMFEITHPWLPFGLNEVVELHHPRLPGLVRAVVQKQTIELATGGLVTSTVRRLT